MPASHYKKISIITDRIERVKDVKSILDVGIGFGKYGVILRERFDIRFKRYDESDWITIIDGVEIYSDYITPMHTYVYDTIYLGDIFELIDNLKRYDVILMIDCLEHLSKWKGREVVRKLFTLCDKLLLFSFPNFFRGDEGYKWPNVRERHRCLWTPKELNELIGKVERIEPTIFAKAK